MIFLTIAAAFVNQFFSNSGSALSILIIMYIGAKITPFLSQTLGKINPFSFTDWHIMWIGNHVIISKLFSVFSIFVGGCLILFAAGFYWFDRRDV
jgi:ABC-2 type transport system permease protein